MSKNKKYSANYSTSTVKEPSQVYNPSTGHFIKRDAESGRFIDVKKDGKPYKGIRKEISKVLANPNIDKKIAEKAEKAVIKIMNSSLKKK